MSDRTHASKSLGFLTLIYGIGSFSLKGISFILLFAMTYFLSTEEVGMYDLIISTLAIIVPIFSISIDQAVVRWLLDESEKSKLSIVLQNAFGLLWFSILLFAVCCFFLFSFYEFEIALVAPFFALTIAMIFFPTLQQAIRGVGMHKLYLNVNLLYSFILLVFNFTLLKLDFGLQGVLIGNISALIFSMIFIFYRTGWYRYFFRPRFDISQIKIMASYSIPLLPNTLSWWLITSSTRYIIYLNLGESQNGVFSIAHKFATLVIIISEIFILAWQEKLISQRSEKEANLIFINLLEKFSNVIFAAILVLCSICKWLVLVVDEPFRSAWMYIPFLLIAVYLQSLAAFYGVMYIRRKETKKISSSSLLGGFATVVVALLLVKYGLLGISISIVCGFIVVLAVRALDISKRLGIILPLKHLILNLLMLTFVIFNLYYGSNLINILFIGLSLIFLYNRNKCLIIRFMENMLKYKSSIFHGRP